MRMKRSRRWLSALLAVLLLLTMIPSVAFAANDSSGDFIKIFHLDCGRKYFSVAQVETLLDSLSKNGYTHMELAIGNDGLRFLLDDMSVTANDTTYTSDAVKAEIQAGNKAYYDAGTNELTQNEMDTIISYAEGKGIKIIPLLNSPGHMDAILDCMESLGISNPAYSSSARTVDVTNTAAVNFTQALIEKYITYFAGKGCTYFNMGCDEYANDVSNSGFAGLISSGKYGSFVTYVNTLASMVKDAGMTPMAFNDGIYYDSNTSSGTFDSDIVIAYWSSGWPGYSPASASFLAGKGHKIINTNDAWYYVLGRQAGNSSGYTIATAQNGVQNTACTDIPGSKDPTADGCMICLWCDTPSASYSDTEVSNVTGLISTFAESNPTYFTVSSDSGETGGDTGDTDSGNTGGVDVTKNETITVVAGETATATIEGYNFAGTYTTENPSIATVEVTGTDAVEATVTYTKASVTCNTLISSNSNSWTAVTGYYYTPDGTNYYPLYAKRSNSKGNNKTYTYTWGYSTTSSTSITQIGTQSTTNTSTTPNITVYTKSSTAGTSASTTVTFTAAADAAGKTTYVTVGNTRYTINVIAEDLSKVDPLNVEYWITNLPVTADGATSKSISAQSAYGEAGVDISTLVPEKGTYAYGSVVFWKGTVLDSSNKQTSASGSENDKTGSGKDFSLIRYYNGNWQYYYEADGTWNTISDTDQVVVYWLQPTEVTKEITTLVKDWGYSPSNQEGDNTSKVALTIAVVYPDGTVSPAESEMYSSSTTLFNYWAGRDIGLVAPVNNSDYEISKITVTDGARYQTGTGQWGASDTIIWEKVTNDAGVEWYDETTYWDETVGGTPMVNGARSNITWSTYNTAKLVLIYLKPIHYDTNLIVNWVDDSQSGALISTMEVAVSSDGTPITFYNGLVQTSALPNKGVGGTFTLDDDAYVTNSSGVPQPFNKNISTVPGVADQYKSGLYQYVSADLSADGKTLTLHYRIDSSMLNKNYVLDFGLPVEIPLSDLVENTGDVSGVTFNVSNTSYDSTSKKITYTPSAVMTGTTTVTATVAFSNSTEKFTIGFVPASNVLYEETFLTPETKNTAYVDWTRTKSTASAQSSAQKTLYGYDDAYADNTGNSMGSSYSAELTSGQSTENLTVDITGATGFDLIGTCGPNTGYVYVMLKNTNTGKVILVDTRYNDTTYDTDSTLHQVPLAHAVFKQGDYNQAIIFGMYNSKNSDAPTQMVEVDGFRVYYDSNNTAYTAEGENGATYTNVLDAVNKSTAAYIEPNTNGTSADPYNKTEYQSKGGPQNEIYLAQNQSVAFNVGTGVTEVQISARAVSDDTGKSVTMQVNGEKTVAISSNTEMYYEVPVDSKGLVTIQNTSANLLALGNLKLPNGTQTVGLTESNLRAVYAMLSAASAPQVFTPDKLDVNVRSTNVIRNKVVTLTVKTSTDVSYLLVNNKKITPSNKRLVDLGIADEYIFVASDIVNRNTEMEYAIYAYDQNSTVSALYTAKG